jgi:hypothetical protein
LCYGHVSYWKGAGWIVKQQQLVMVAVGLGAVVGCGTGAGGTTESTGSDAGATGNSASEPTSAAAIRQSLDTPEGVYAFLDGKTLVMDDLIPPDPFGVFQCLHKSTIHFSMKNSGKDPTWDWSPEPGADVNGMCDTSSVGTQPIPGVHGAPFLIDYASNAGDPTTNFGCFNIILGDMNNSHEWSGRATFDFNLTTVLLEVYVDSEVSLADCHAGPVGSDVNLNNMQFSGSDAEQRYHIQ